MRKSFIRLKTVKSFAACVLLASATLPHYAFANCEKLSDQQIADIRAGNVPDGPGDASQTYAFNVIMPASVEIDPDLPIGGLIATGDSPVVGGVRYFAACGVGDKLPWTYFDATQSSIDGVYNTGIQGVGFRVTYIRGAGAGSSQVPFDSKSNATPEIYLSYIRIPPGTFARVELIKTGNIASKVLVTQGTVVRATAFDGFPVVTVQGGSTVIKVLPRCAVSASELNINFNDFGPRQVSTTEGPQRDVDFSLTCSGPTPPASITATLTAMADTTNPSLIKNSSSGAQHLGIQLKERSTGTVLIPNDINSKIEHRPSGAMQDNFALEAMVLRTGAQTPTAGRIDATATITLSIL